LAGNYVKDESLSSLIHLISSTSQLQTYSVHKIFFCLRENLNQDGLIKVGLWCVGEFGGLLTSGKAVGPDGVPISVTDEEVSNIFFFFASCDR
jgi:AP-1 complex subunit gamma-1